MDRVGPLDGLGGAAHLLDGAGADHREALELGVVGVEPARAAEPDVHPEQQRDLGERAGDVRVVADVGHGLTGEDAEALSHRERVGERLERVRDDRRAC